MNEEIREIAASIWETLFSDPLDRADADQPIQDPAVTGCVQIHGAFNGAVTLQCSKSLATRLAGELFRGEAPTPADVLDSVGELTNMLAGNIKALLADPSHISLPAVAFGADYALTVIGTSPMAVVGFRCGEEPLLVTLLQGSDPGPS